MIELSNLSGKEKEFYDSFMLRSWDRPNWKRIQTNMRRAFTFNDAKIYFRMFVTNDWSRHYFINSQGERIPFAELDWDKLTEAMLKTERKRVKPYSVKVALFHQMRRNSFVRSKPFAVTDYFYVIASDDPARYKFLFNGASRDGYHLVNESQTLTPDRKQFLDASHEFLLNVHKYIDESRDTSHVFGTPQQYGLFHHLEIGNIVSKSRVGRLMYNGERNI